MTSVTLTVLGDPAHRICPHTKDTLAGLLTLALVAAGEAASIGEATERVLRSALG